MLLGLALALILPDIAQAKQPKNKPERKGGQAELMVGASVCIPGKSDCQAEGVGNTAPSIGMAFDLGWRAHPAFFIGAGYGVGWFNPNWDDGFGERLYNNAFQQGVFGVLRAYIPIWRIDIGFELSPGWSRQTFVAAEDQNFRRSYTQGFALRPGLSLDIWLGRHVFLGAKVDTIFNVHREACLKTETSRECDLGGDSGHARVHQLIGGVHFGGSF